MAELYLDSVSASLKVALQVDQSTLACKAQSQQGSKTLFRELDNLLSEAQIKPREIKAVYFNRGPGSFTGIKVGHVFSQALALLSGAAIGSFTTFDLMAMQVEDFQGASFLLYAYQREYFLARSIGGNWHFDVISMKDAMEVPRAFFWGPEKYCLKSFIQIAEMDADYLPRLQGSGCLKATSEPLYLKKSNAEINLDRSRKNPH